MHLNIYLLHQCLSFWCTLAFLAGEQAALPLTVLSGKKLKRKLIPSPAGIYSTAALLEEQTEEIDSV